MSARRRAAGLAAGCCWVVAAFFALTACGPKRDEPTATTAATPTPQPTPTPLDLGDLPAEQRAMFQPLEGNRTLFNGITIDAARRELAFDGRVNMNRGLIEVLIAGPNGKLHEAVLVSDIRPLDLHTAALLLGLRPGPNPAWRLPEEPELRPPGWDRPPGSLATLWVDWTTTAGTACRVRAEQLLSDQRQGGSLAPTDWVFVGSRLDERGAYLADGSGSLVTNFHDTTAVFDLPLPAGQSDDYIFAAEALLPPPGTPVRLTVALPQPQS